jgi:teichoic acid transport system ATP-binding protein
MPVAEQAIRQPPQPPDPDAPPMVIVEDVHLVYRVTGRRRRLGGGSGALARIARRTQHESTREIHAVRGVSLVARRGEAIGLIGPNGSGKSTLLRAIAGVMPPARGHIYTVGEPALLSVGAVLIPELSGERNVILGCLAMGMTPAEVREHYDDIVSFAGLPGDFITLPMNTYSSGMSARLRFAIAAAKTREVLLIDEALATGDAQFRRRSEQRIRDLCDEAGTIFLVSHGLGVIRQTCNRAIWLDEGQIIMDGPVEDVVDAYEDRYDPEARAGRMAGLVDEGAVGDVGFGASDSGTMAE